MLTCVAAVGLLSGSAAQAVQVKRINVGGFGGFAGTITLTFETCSDPLRDCAATGACGTPLCQVNVNCNQVDTDAMANAFVSAINAAACPGYSAVAVGNGFSFDVTMPNGVCMCMSDTPGVGGTLRNDCGPVFMCGATWNFSVDFNDPPAPPCVDVSFCTINGAECAALGSGVNYQFTLSNCGGSPLTTVYMSLEAGDGGPFTPNPNGANDISLSGWTPSLCFGWNETATRARAIVQLTKNAGSLLPGQSVSGTIKLIPSTALQAIPGSADTVPASGFLAHVTHHTPAELGVSCPGGTFGPYVAGQAASWSTKKSVVCGATLCGALPGDVIITEIMYNPNSPEAPGGTFPALTEWVEIYNRTNHPIDISGWYLADEDGRCGDFPPGTTIPPAGIRVVIPTGSVLSGPLTKTTFASAWNVAEASLIQPSATNDLSGARPANGAEGGIVGSGLSNSPTNDGNDANDLVNTPFDPTTPCPWGQAFCVLVGANPPDNEVLLLVAPAGAAGFNDDLIIDKVNFADSSPWPSDSPDGPSIELKPDKLTATDNDLGANWQRSALGVNRAHSNNNTVTPFTGNDIGSPGEIQGVTVGNQAPSAVGQTVFTSKNASIDITLSGFDDGLPSATLNYIVDTLPANGQLRDVNNGNVQITTVPYTIPGQQNLVRYINNGTCGNDSFNFHVNDTALASATATNVLKVQCGDVVITEIMYNPQSAPDPAGSERRVEWLEVYNTTASAIDASGWRMADRSGQTGVFPTPTNIPAHGLAVVIPGGQLTGCTVCTTTQPGDCTETNRDLLPADFTAAWGTIPQIIQPRVNGTFSGSCYVDPADNSGGTLGSGLANQPPAVGEQVQIIDGSGKVQDVANYTNATPWPVSASSDRWSIYLLPPATNYTAAANDDGTKWKDSNPADGNGAYGNTVTAIFNGNDIGSPGFLAGVSGGQTRPTPKAELLSMVKDTALTITLNADDDGLPAGIIRFKITQLPVRDFSPFAAAGTLTDPNGGGPGVPTVIAAVPYTLANTGGGQPGNQVIYTPTAGLTGAMAFEFVANDTALDGGPARDRIAVQDTSVIITEIMFNPSNQPDTDWEWVELTNTSGAAVAIDSIRAGRTTTIAAVGTGNASVLLAAGERWILANQNVSALFANEWGLSPAQQARVFFVQPALWNGLVQPDGGPSPTIRIFDATNGLFDQVSYDDNVNGWPNSPSAGGPSVFLREAVRPPATPWAVFNDSGINWAVSDAGCDGAIATPDADESPNPPVDDSDTGSPFVASTNTYTAGDCNHNGILDNCDILAGRLTDNSPANGVPDECELTCSTCRGDMNGDGKYNGADINMFVKAYVQGTTAPFIYSPCADINGNLDIANDDLLSFLDLLLHTDLACNVTTITIAKAGTTIGGTLNLSFFEAADPTAMPPETPEACGVQLDCPPGIFGIDVCSVSVSVVVGDTAATLAGKIVTAVNAPAGTCFGKITAVQVGNQVKLAHENPRERLAGCLSITGAATNDTNPTKGYTVGGANGCGVNNVLDGVAGNEAAVQGANGFSFAGLTQ
ncbi:MAG: lamin tail domain-containing protein [Phycisphaerae bacterium]